MVGGMPCEATICRLPSASAAPVAPATCIATCTTLCNDASGVGDGSRTDSGADDVASVGLEKGGTESIRSKRDGTTQHVERRGGNGRACCFKRGAACVQCTERRTAVGASRSDHADHTVHDIINKHSKKKFRAGAYATSPPSSEPGRPCEDALCTPLPRDLPPVQSRPNTVVPFPCYPAEISRTGVQKGHRDDAKKRL